MVLLEIPLDFVPRSRVCVVEQFTLIVDLVGRDGVLVFKVHVLESLAHVRAVFFVGKRERDKTQTIPEQDATRDSVVAIYYKMSI